MNEFIFLASRNNPLGFAERTRTNLEFIEQAYSQGANVHVVTQLMLSLLGLIVFPVEKKNYNRIRQEPVEAIWQIGIGVSENMGTHLRNLRNAIAHRHVIFSSDSRDIGEVSIQFSNHYGANPKPYWQAEIKASHLKEFCFRLISMIEAS